MRASTADRHAEPPANQPPVAMPSVFNLPATADDVASFLKSDMFLTFTEHATSANRKRCIYGTRQTELD